MRKKRFLKKVKKGCQGAISIMLCILVTPFLTIAGVLVEYSRMQNAAETVQEILDSSLLSTLANYDEYVEDRFGVFAISQEEKNYAEIFQGYVDANINILGKAATINSATATGTYPLSEISVLKTQLLDFSESTVFTDMLLYDFQLDELIEKLNNLKGLTELEEMTGNIADVSTDVSDLVTKVKELSDTISSISTKTMLIQDRIVEFCESFKSLYDALNNGGYGTLRKEYDEERQKYFFYFEKDGEIIDIDVLANETFAPKIRDIIDKGNAALSGIDDLKTTISELPAKVRECKDTLQKVKASMEKTKNDADSFSSQTEEANQGEAMKESTAEVADAYDVILKSLESALDNFADDTADVLVNSVNAAVDSFTTEIKENYPILNGVDLSTNPNDILTTIVSVLYENWGEDTSAFVQKLIEAFAPGFLQSVSNIRNISTIFAEAISNAEDAFENEIKDGIANTLSALVESVKSLFDLDVFYNGDMNAYLSDATFSQLLSSEEQSPYQTFLNGIVGLFAAANSFVSELSGFDLLGALKAIKDLFTSLGTVLSSAVSLTREFMTKISEFAEYATGKSMDFYDFFLLSGYMTHNLPNRTSGSDWKSVSQFSYGDIPFAGSGSSNSPAAGLQGMANFLSGNPGSSGTSETMFCGAELEYIVAGTQSEIMNQIVAFMQLYILRLIFNIPTVFKDNAVKGMAAAANIASWAVYLLVLLGEPLVDTIFLVNGEECLLLKNQCYLSPIGLPTLINKLTDMAVHNEKLKNAISNEVKDKLTQSGNGGVFEEKGIAGFNVKLNYENYMLLSLMLMTSEERMLQRVADLIQLEANCYYQKAENGGYTFNIRESYTCITSSTNITFNPFISLLKVNGFSAFTVDMQRDRSY